jgi:hypothetical protein
LLAADPKYWPPATADVDTAVTRPLAFTVITGMELDDPKAPVLELTVANVKADAPAEVVASPVNAGNLPVGNVPLEILLALVVSVVADATRPRFVRAVETDATSDRLLADDKKPVPDT